MTNRLDNRGVSLVEITIVLGLLAVVVSALVELNLTLSRRMSSASLDIAAAATAAETMEALRALRDESWSNLGDLSPGTDYYLSFSEAAKKWAIQPSDSGKISGVFSRSFRVSPVYRDLASGGVVASGGSLDVKTLLVEANIVWDERGRSKDIKLQTYLTDY